MNLFQYVYHRLLGRSLRWRRIAERVQARRRVQAVRRIPIPELR